MALPVDAHAHDALVRGPGSAQQGGPPAGRNVGQPRFNGGLPVHVEARRRQIQRRRLERAARSRGRRSGRVRPRERSVAQAARALRSGRGTTFGRFGCAGCDARRRQGQQEHLRRASGTGANSAGQSSSPNSVAHTPPSQCAPAGARLTRSACNRLNPALSVLPNPF